MTHQKRDFQD